MQYSLRNILVAMAVAGTGAAVFCSRFVGTYTELPSETIFFVVPVLFGATLMGLIAGRKRTGIARAGWWVMPPILAAIALVPVLKSYLRASVSANGTRAALACKEFAEAEEAYHLTDWDHDGVLEYAPTLKELRAKLAAAGSKINIQQGLADAEWPSITPFHGYYFKIFKSQKTPIARSFLDKSGRLTVGYALGAWPAQYGWSGGDQFMISNSGTIYQVDYGKDIEHRLDRVNEFSPDAPHWTCDD